MAVFFKFCIAHQSQRTSWLLFSQVKIKLTERERSEATCCRTAFTFSGKGVREAPPTCHEEKESSHVLGQAFLPEEADRGHNAATEQDSHSHAQEASSDPS